MKVFTKLGIALLAVVLTTGMLWAQSTAYDIAPKKPISQIASDDLFDLQFEFPVGVGGGEAGLETDGNYIYTSKWNGTGEFYRYELDGTYLEQITVAGSGGCRDIAYNGTYFYGGAAATTVFEMDLANATMISTFTAPTPCRAIAYNEDDDVFYANNWGSDITMFDASGANLGSWSVGPVGDSYYGFAYQGASYCGDGPYLWGAAQVGTNLNTLVQMDLPSGAETGVTFDVGTVLSGVDLAGGLAIDNNLVPGYWTILGTSQNLNIFGVELCASGPLPNNDIGVSAIVAPSSGVGLTSAEPVTVTIKNFGTDTQTSFDVSFTLDGGTPVVESISTTLNGGDTYDHTFATTVDLSAVGSYDIQACTDLTGDENTGNDCKDKTVENMVPAYCDASTTTEDEWILDVICGDINNVGTGWQGGVADYTDQSTTIDAGASEDITVNNGNAWASDIVYCWVDWNMDYVLEQGGDEEFQLLNVGGTGETFTGQITVPAGTPNGDYRMRVRMTYSTAPEPCGNSSYGEVEDYTITVGGSGVVLDPPTNLTGTVMDNDVELMWDGVTTGGDGEWIQWDDMTNADGIGLTAGGNFLTGSRWTPADLAAYDGQYLTKVSFYVYNNVVSATYNIMVWTGPDAGTQVLSQPVTSYTVDAWNEIELTTPVMIDASDELWFGLEVDHPAGENPAGVDPGPALAYNGDMISLDGVNWVSMSTDYGLDYNWNLAGYVVESTDATTLAQPMVKETPAVVANASFETGSQNGYTSSNKKFTPNGTKALLGYNVYRDATNIGFTTETTYMDMDLDPGTYDYEVTALYDEGESDPTNTYTAIIEEQLNCENFDALTVGGLVADQLGGMWTTWGGTTADDAPVSDTYSNSPSNSFTVNTAAVDLVYMLDNDPITSGQWVYSHYMYVPTGYSGYFNIQSEPTPGVDWVIELYFDDDGTGYFAGQSTDTYTYTMNTWFMVEIMFDMDAGTAKVYFDGTMILEFDNTMTIGGVDYYGSDSGGTPGAYYDDVCFDEDGGTTPSVIFEDDFEAYSVGDQLACENSAWTTWSAAPCGDEDPFIVDNVTNVVEITAVNDLVYVMPNYTDGAYEISFDMYVPAGYDGYFNTLQEFAGASSQWGMQVYFDAGGAGSIDGGGAAAATFTFAYDTWMSLKTTVDLDNDWAEFYVDGTLIHGWVWSSGTFGTGTLNQLGGSNFYAYAGTQSPLYHFDNFVFAEMANVPPPAGPENVNAVVENENDVHVTWDEPAGAGSMMELVQHDGNPENAYYQAYDNAYGVVYDLSAYPGATVELFDFRHSSWGITGTWDYKLHIVDWDTYTTIAVLDGLQTTGDDQWEEGIALGSVGGYDMVGVFLEPLSNDPADAYPCIDSDNVGPDGMSYNGALGDFSAFGLSTIGDFLMDLWIMTADGKMVQANKATVNSSFNSTAQARNGNAQMATVPYKVEQSATSYKSTLALLGYNVLRDGTNIGYVAAPTTMYDDMDLNPGTYEYCVTAVYDDGESNPECADPVTIDDPTFPAPTNLEGMVVGEDIVLSWDSPGDEWIQWDAGTNTGNGIGLTNGGTFSVASHWEPSDLTMYNGLALTQVQFFANADPAATYVIKVWTGAAGTNEVLSQPVASFNVDDFNTVDLNTPVTISSATDFWFGYEVTHGAGTFPAGCDDGPAVAYKGDMITTGGGWQSLSVDIGLDYNWNIAGYVELADKGAVQMTGTTVTPAATGSSFEASGSTGVVNKMDMSGTKDFIDFNLYYKFGVTGTYSELASTTETTYTHEGMALVVGSHYYYVTAEYDEGESDPSNTEIVVITGVDEMGEYNTNLYPNPATDNVTITSDAQIESITIYNFSGQHVATETVNGNNYRVNTSEFNSGVYFFMINTDRGQISQRIIIE